MPTSLFAASPAAAATAAAAAGDSRAVLTLLDEGTKIDERDGDGRTVLHHAAAAGHAHLVETLLGRGAQFETVDEGAWSPLHSAASAGRGEVVDVLVKAGAQLEKGAGSSGSTPLVLGSSKGHQNVVRALLGGGANTLAVDSSGATSLHRAAGNGHVAILDMLISCHVSATSGTVLLDKRDKAGHTAFHIAAIHQQEAACVALAEAGVDLETVNAEGIAPASLLKPSLRSQLGLTVEGVDEDEEDNTDWLGMNFPIPQPARGA